MKIVFVFSVVVLLVVVHAGHDKHSKECLEETEVTESEVSEFLLGDDTDTDSKSMKFLMCVFKKNEDIDDDGHLDVEKAKETVKSYMAEVDAGDDQQALDCVKEKDTVEDTVLTMAKCVEKRRAELTSSKK